MSHIQDNEHRGNIFQKHFFTIKNVYIFINKNLSLNIGVCAFIDEIE